MIPAGPRLPWYVVSTRPRKEEFARMLLEQAGIAVFVPLVLEWSRSRRRTSEKVNLLFPGYLFVRMSLARDYARVRWTPGVGRVLGPDEHPTTVDESLIDEISARMGSKGYIVQRAELAPGDRVEVKHGPLAGLLGLVEGPSTAPERVRILLTFFARRATVEMDGRDVLRLGHGC
ncbi:MAG TPA: transcription termination/antitermination NusG family protein [Patescibacteria group bacterium]|nr:transcription termination/antitermination NusG family protein [Patescibacteria group bacterium]